MVGTRGHAGKSRSWGVGGEGLAWSSRAPRKSSPLPISPNATKLTTTRKAGPCATPGHRLGTGLLSQPWGRSPCPRSPF